MLGILPRVSTGLMKIVIATLFLNLFFGFDSVHADTSTLVTLFDQVVALQKAPLDSSAKHWREKAEALAQEESGVQSLEYELENSPLAEKKKRYAELSGRLSALGSPEKLLKSFRTLKLVRDLRNLRNLKQYREADKRIRKMEAALKSEVKRRAYLREMLSPAR